MSLTQEQLDRLRDPLVLASVLWPHVTFYKQQREILYSVRDNHETFVVAGNEVI